MVDRPPKEPVGVGANSLPTQGLKVVLQLAIGFTLSILIALLLLLVYSIVASLTLLAPWQAAMIVIGGCIVVTISYLIGRATTNFLDRNIDNG